MSDVTAGILILAKVETATVFPWYLSTPPPSTNATLETWKLDREVQSQVLFAFLEVHKERLIWKLRNGSF